jgi:hypothetical protein
MINIQVRKKFLHQVQPIIFKEKKCKIAEFNDIIRLEEQLIKNNKAFVPLVHPLLL